ncbi:TonB-dependent receptor [Asticcacaulis sp. DXS10W]|uniref:TonB-dependent receptor n=1 Tax=Asticcacaulis currens TaxID=2984210 RepID=A0ABT5IBF1_9CAUL|nr:TonB-dependent receptor [Asticcacaulis currens]MDC7693504.1 TonB-dependent receptor [Asticcacaulis currens]
MTPVTNRKYHSSVSLSAMALAAALVCAAPAYAQAPKYKLDIPAESAAKALNDFAEQAGLQILFPYEAADVGRVPAIKGEYTREDALKLILAGTNLEVARQDEKTISLRVIKSPLAGAADEAVEVIVTGTHIRGANPTSPVRTLTRKDIENSGYGQVGDLIRSLPENFSGGQNPGIIGTGAGGPDQVNHSNASTVNLRGLGTDASLVLVNGHRLAYDTYFQASDISGIPLLAIQRVDVVPDGASALYGSDAVAGVVNFILRKNYSGTTTSLLLGGTTQGGGAERTYSVLSGWAGDRGYLLANLEHSEQEAITFGQRNLAGTPTTTLQRPQDRNSLYLSGGLFAGARTEITLDALVSERTAFAKLSQFVGYPAYMSRAHTPAHSVALALETELGSSWQLRVAALNASSRFISDGKYETAATFFRTNYRSQSEGLEATLNGRAFTLPTGEVKVALGGGYRKERFRNLDPNDVAYFNKTRDVRFIYGEALVPLVAANPDRPGLQALELNLSARSEHYSDFGGTSTPKIGLRYVPMADLTLRASWGKSFKAPSFLQTYQARQVYYVNLPFVGGTGTQQALVSLGGNYDLTPERSTSKTVGIDYQTSRFSRLRLGLNVFSVDYTDRVVLPIAVYSQSLSSPLYAPFVQYNPTLSEVQALVGSAVTFLNYARVTYDPSTVRAIVRNQYTNATSQTAEGVDVSYGQTFSTDIGEIGTFANISHIEVRQQTLPTTPETVISGLIFRAPELKGRAGLTWQSNGWSANATANYVSGSTDVGVTPAQPIGSWTTLDAQLAYTFPSRSDYLRGTRIALSAINLLDRRPPYAASPSRDFPGVDFDSTNASIIGRSISLTLVKAW